MTLFYPGTYNHVWKHRHVIQIRFPRGKKEVSGHKFISLIIQVKKC